MSVALVIAVMVMFSVSFAFIRQQARRREAERAEEYRKAASLRGWQLEYDGRDDRYSGTTEGVSWTAVVGYRRERGAEQNDPRPLRWQTTAVRLDEGALVIWPDLGQGIDAIRTPGVPQFVLELAMRPVASALGVPGADGATLARAMEVVQGPPGYLYRATDPARMRRWLDHGAAEALGAEAGWLADQSSPQRLIIAVLWKHGLQMATPYGDHDLDRIARLARVGAHLARAAGEI